jgi:hypothetical protein
MTFWNPKCDHELSTNDNDFEIPCLTKEDLKVAVVNYVHLHKSGSEFLPTKKDQDILQIIDYSAVPIDQLFNTCNIYKLSVNFTASDGKHTVNFILKVQNPEIDKGNRLMVHQRQTYLKEITFYGCIIPKMKEFLPWHHNELPFPHCYLAKSKDQSMHCCNAKHASPCCFLPGSADILLVEDVTRVGCFKLTKEFSLAHVKLAVRSLAKLHAMSVELNRRGLSHGCTLAQTFPSLTEETMYSKHFNIDWHTKFTAGMQIFSAIGPLMDNEILLPGKDISPVVSVMMKDLWGLLKEILQPHAEHLNALCLTECDIKSFSFSNDDQHSVRSCKIIEFQHIKYSRPAVDLVNLLYNCTSPDIRSQNWKYLLEIYHEEFHQVISKCHLKYHPTLPLPVGLLSLAELQAAYHECEILGATRRAIETSFACLFEYDPYTSDPQENLYLQAQQFVNYQHLPSRSDLRQRAMHAFKTDPRYKAQMYKYLGRLLECLARTVNCNRAELHFKCPHPKLQ